MSEENYLKVNIKHLREDKGISQPQLAEALGCSRDNIASYERGTEPKLAMLQAIVNYFHVSIDDIINKDLKKEIQQSTPQGTTHLLPHKEHGMTGLSSGLQSKNQEYTSANIMSIPIVDVSAAAGDGYFNSDHPETLGELSFPVNLLRKKHGNYYCGRVNGESMAPTLLNQDFIIFRLLQFDEWVSVKDYDIYFIVDRSGTSCVKRVKNLLKEEKSILCMSDNLDKTNFRNFTIHGEDIANIYHVEWRFSKDMTDINRTFTSRVDDIEDRLKNIESIMKKKP